MQTIMMKLAMALDLQGCADLGEAGLVLDRNGVRPDDSPTGAHADVVVVKDKCYIFYFTHPGRKTHGEATLDKDGVYPYSERRSPIQVAELVFRDGTLAAVRDEPFDFWLPDLN